MDGKRTAKQTAGVSAEIETVRRWFEQLRTQRQIPNPIPDRLWDQAIRFAQQYGSSRISKICRLEYSRLKERSPVYVSSTVFAW